ncbi:MAG: hypothetical protein MK108_15930 [Mariniblastus sp.]|nr:hypothetical protein [Mariniblastus sp.]
MKSLNVLALGLACFLTTTPTVAGIITFEDVHGLVGDNDIVPGPSSFDIAHLDELVNFKSPNGTYNRGEKTAFGMTQGDYMGFWLNEEGDAAGLQITFSEEQFQVGFKIAQHNVSIPASFAISMEAMDGSWEVEFETFPLRDVANEAPFYFQFTKDNFPGDVGFDQVKIEFLEGSSTHLYMDELRWGDDARVPEPTTMLVWSTLLGIGLTCRRRR